MNKKFSIKINEKPDSIDCKFSCDNNLHEKLEKYEITKFLNKSSCNLFIGKPAQGKTSLLYNLFKNKKLLNKVYDEIIIFQPQSSRESMNDQLFNELPDNQKYEELTQKNLLEVYNNIIDKKKKTNTALIFDDLGSSFKNKEIKTLFKKLVMNRRHLKLSIFVLIQTYKSLEKDVRKLFINIWLFKASQPDVEEILYELIVFNKKDIPDLINFVFDKKYNYLFMNTESNRVFKNWDEIIIKY